MKTNLSRVRERAGVRDLWFSKFKYQHLRQRALTPALRTLSHPASPRLRGTGEGEND